MNATLLNCVATEKVNDDSIAKYKFTNTQSRSDVLARYEVLYSSKQNDVFVDCTNLRSRVYRAYQLLVDKLRSVEFSGKPLDQIRPQISKVLEQAISISPYSTKEYLGLVKTNPNFVWTMAQYGDGVGNCKIVEDVSKKDGFRYSVKASGYRYMYSEKTWGWDFLYCEQGLTTYLKVTAGLES
jgi:hypothetical protein